MLQLGLISSGFSSSFLLHLVFMLTQLVLIHKKAACKCLQAACVIKQDYARSLAAMSAAAVNNTSVEEFNAVSAES